MADETLRQTVESIGAKARALAAERKLLVEERTHLLAENASLRADVESQKALIKRLELDNESLKMARLLAPDHHDAEKAYRVISGLVRNIDKCIEDLKRQPVAFEPEMQ